MEDLPGFRFHPTEEELLDFYLRQVAQGKKLPFDIITTVHLYRHDPSELPGLARMTEEKEWYFFVPMDRRPAGGGRPSRTTERGFWKATGSDRPVRSSSDPRRLIGLKKTLVFYRGRAPRGTKTDWVMNEYRLPDFPPHKEDIVRCKVYRKAASLKELEQRAAMSSFKKVAGKWNQSGDTTIDAPVAASVAGAAPGWLGDIEGEVHKDGGIGWSQDNLLTQLHNPPIIEQWPTLGEQDELNF